MQFKLAATHPHQRWPRIWEHRSTSSIIRRDWRLLKLRRAGQRFARWCRGVSKNGDVVKHSLAHRPPPTTPLIWSVNGYDGRRRGDWSAPVGLMVSERDWSRRRMRHGWRMPGLGLLLHPLFSPFVPGLQRHHRGVPSGLYMFVFSEHISSQVPPF